MRHRFSVFLLLSCRSVSLSCRCAFWSVAAARSADRSKASAQRSELHGAVVGAPQSDRPHLHQSARVRHFRQLLPGLGEHQGASGSMSVHIEVRLHQLPFPLQLGQRMTGPGQTRPVVSSFKTSGRASLRRGIRATQSSRNLTSQRLLGAQSAWRQVSTVK